MTTENIRKLDSEVSRQTIEIPSYYRINYKTGKIRFDDEEMRREFEYKLKKLKEKYE